MVSLLVKWQTMHDLRVCPICRALEESGYTWVLQGGETELYHPTFGLVWTLDSGSDAHGNHAGSCRCNLTFDFDYSDLVPVVQRLYDTFVVGGKEAEAPTKL